MTLALILLAVLVGLAGASAYLTVNALRRDRDVLFVCGILATALIGVLTIVFAVALAAISIDKRLSRQACETFAEESERETKFVVYAFDRWDCLTPSEDGKWISTSALRDEVTLP